MLLFWLFFLVPAIFANEVSQFLEVVETTGNAEFYDLQGVRYAIYLERVTYTEANVLCAARKSMLVELRETEVANFLARALAESAVGYTSLWVGGKLVGEPEQVGVFKWNSGATIPVDEKNTKYPEITYPFWAQKPELKVDPNVSTCIAFDRRGHENPLIVELACTQPRPFICQRPTGNGTTDPVEILPPFLGKDKLFHLYVAQLTWAQSLSFCRARGYRLASLETDIDYDAVQHRMLRSRPIIENAWMGGIFENGHWKWMATNKLIPTVTLSPNTSDAPPWYHNPIIQSGCLLADRHICGSLVFLEADCARKRSIICEEIITIPIEPDLIRIHNTTYWIGTKEETWWVAMRKCQTCFPNSPSSTLLTLDGDVFKILADIEPGMTITLNKDIRHIHIGGKLGVGKSSGFYYWVTNDMLNSSNPWPESAIVKVTSQNVNGIVYRVCKWTETVSRFDFTPYPCLNLDREDQRNYFAYGLKCDVKQYYICNTGQLDATLAESCAGQIMVPTEAESVTPPSTTTTTYMMTLTDIRE